MPLLAVYQNASPSAPILPLPVTLKLISTSHQSNVVLNLPQIDPFWLRSDGVMRTLSSLAMASNNQQSVRVKTSAEETLSLIIGSGKRTLLDSFILRTN